MGDRMFLMSNEEFKKTGGDLCPRCESPYKRPDGSYHKFNGFGSQKMKCPSCGLRWTEFFSLEGYIIND